MKKKIISKQSYLTGLRCLKAMYLKFHHPELMNSGENTNQAAMAAGLEFERTVMNLVYPGGTDVTTHCNHLDFTSFQKKTLELMQRRTVTIYQATFQTKTGERILADAVVKKGKAIDLIEVKAVTVLQDYHYYDAAYQLFTIENSGYKVKRVILAHVNKEYVRQGDLSQDLVIQVDVTKKVRQIQQKIKLRLASFRNTLKQKECPDVEIGFHCSDPYPCALIDYCHKQRLPEQNIFQIRGLRTKEKLNYYWAGITSLKQVKESALRLNNSQQIQVDCAISGETIFEREKVYAWLRQLQGFNGLYYLDFETVCLATPMCNASVPYEHIPIQFSIHHHNVSGALQHHDFLADPNSVEDQRLLLLKRMLYVLNLYGNKLPIVTFNSSFESGRMNYLSRAFPEYKKEIKSIQDRLVDLADIFRNKWYYSPLFKGSYSIKYVLPVLCKNISYDSLEIRNGSMASVAYLELKNHENPEKLRSDMLAYCAMDTLAMVKIMAELQKMIENN